MRCLIKGVLTLAFLLSSTTSSWCQPLSIGLIADLTGPFAPFGTDIMRGARAAVEDIKSIGGHPIDLHPEDSRSVPPAAREMANKLIQLDKVQAIIVGPLAGQILAANDASRTLRVPMLGIGLLTLPLANRFAVNLGDTLGNMMAGAVAYARNTTSPQMPRVDLMNDNIFGDALRSAAKEAGVALISPSQLTVASVIFSFDKSGSQIAETTQIPPGSVLIGGPLLHRTAIDLIPKLPRDVKLVAFDLRNPVLEDLANLPVSLKGRAGPEPYAYYGYAAVQILAAALAKAGSSGDAVADALRKDTYETAVGRVTFQASDGERLQPSLALYVTSTGGALSFCPSCSTNTDDCKDKGCPCQDKSCSKDCCPGH